MQPQLDRKYCEPFQLSHLTARRIIQGCWWTEVSLTCEDHPVRGRSFAAPECTHEFELHALHCLQSVRLAFPYSGAKCWPENTSDTLVGSIAQFPLLLEVDLSGDIAWETAVGVAKAQSDQLRSLGMRGLRDRPPLTASALPLLPSLTTLDMRESGIINLPSGLFDATPNLRRLFVSYNQIKALPDDVFLPMRSLEYLDLGYNEVSSFPEAVFAGNSHLQYLNIARNFLRRLPLKVFHGLSGLQGLDLGANYLADWQSGLFAPLTSLVELWMSHNRLTIIPSGAFDSLTNLHTLQFGKNRIATIPRDAFAPTKNLTWLAFYLNPIESLHPQVFSGLTFLRILHFNGNQVKVITSSLFAGLTRLMSLDISGNPLHQLPKDIFSHMPNLIDLSLAECQIEQDVSPHLDQTPRLKYLNVSFNDGLTMASRPWHSLPLVLLEVSATSIPPEPQMCVNGASLGLRGMEKSQSLLNLVIRICLNRVAFLDVSANPSLNNVTLMSSTLAVFSVPLAVTEDDANAGGISNIPYLQMEDNPVQCLYQAGFVRRVPPQTLMRTPVGDGMAFLPAMVYSCDCAPGYVERSDGICAPFWSTTRIAGVVIGCALATSLMLANILVPLYRKRRKVVAATLELRQRLLNEADDELTTIRNSWRIKWEDVSEGEVIGSGSFGVVIRAKWMSRDVALKRLLNEETLEMESKGFEAEASIMSTLRHPNIVTFFGAGVDDRGRPFLVTELMEIGSIRGLLDDVVGHPHLSWEQKLRFAQDIVSGMMFLHSRDPPMMHRDLKPDNVLLDARWVAKVADFGTLRQCAGDHSWDSLGAREVLRDPQLLGDARHLSSPQGQVSLQMAATAGCGSPLWVAPEVTSLSRNGISQ